MSTYDFGKTSFRNYVWVKGGQPFQDPLGLDIEMNAPGAFRLEVYDDDALVRTYRKKGQHGGWTSFYFNGSAVDDFGHVQLPLHGTYKLKLVNEAAGTREAHQGSLRYA